jgi:hypothetical protein
MLLMAALIWAVPAVPAVVDRSDLNGDGGVDTLDLEIFSDEFLNQDWQTVDWCQFYESSIDNPKYFRSITGSNPDRYQLLLDFIAVSFSCHVTATSGDKSDLDGSGTVELGDLVIFSENYLEAYWEYVDWCAFHAATLAGATFEGRSTHYFLRHFGTLLRFINDDFGCGGDEPPPSAVLLENPPRNLARVAYVPGPTGEFYVTDPRVGSVFIYDGDLVPRAEIKGLHKPLGVAVDAMGNILVGNDGRDNVEVYDPATGDLLDTFGDGQLEMPNAITLDGLGNIYVTDSRRHVVQVFDSAYNPVRTIGAPGSGPEQLKFPVDAEIMAAGTGQELFVADQGNKRVQVYDLAGNWLRTITFEGTEGQNCNWFTGVCEIPGLPPFTRPQALASDGFGRLHVLDNFGAAGLMFDPADGSVIAGYGAYGEDAGSLRVPLDVVVTEAGVAVVIAGDGPRIELFDVQ